MERLRIKTLCNILILLGILIVTMACGKSQPISKSAIHMNLSNTKDVVYGARDFGSTLNISDFGIFYLKDSKMQFYDIEAEESYVLCGKANCNHSNSSCSAWYENMNDVTGLALYGENVYAIKLNEENNTYDLFSMSPTGDDQRIIYSLDIGDYVPNSWTIYDISDVYYASNMVWIMVNYQYTREPTQDSTEFDYIESRAILGINLEDGAVTSLNELPKDEFLYWSKDNPAYEFKFVSNDYIIISQRWNELEQVGEKEFYAAYEQGDFEEFHSNIDPYYEYLKWYEEEREPMYRYLIYNMKNEELYELESGKEKPIIGYDGEIAGSYDPYIFMDMYEGRVLYQVMGEETMDMPVNLLDMETKKREYVLEIEDGGILSTTDSRDVSSILIDGEKILYCRYTGNEKADVYLYDMNTKEHIKLFQDDRAITFRMVGEIGDKYIGTIYNFTLEEKDVYTIDKEDYHKGNLKAAKKLSL